MTIVPDDKDWTWVLARPCPECEYEAASLDPAHMGRLLRDNGAAWHAALAAGDHVRTRTVPDRWSVLEYGCHVRDVFRLFDHRLRRMLDEDDPLFVNWDQDATAIDDRYGEQDPALVAAEVIPAADALAARFDTVTGDQWQRPGRRSDGAQFTVETFARYLMHDPVHHLWDIAR